MSIFFKKKQKPMKSILSLNIDFASRVKENFKELEPGRSYSFGKEEQKTSYEEIRDFIIETVEIDMKKSLDKISDLEILEIKVVKEYSGSIELVLTILFGSFSLISGMKSFYDNIVLIKNLSREFIKRKLRKKYRIDFDVSTHIEYPQINRFSPEEFFHQFHRRGVFPFPIQSRDDVGKKRDGFFYYLLISNIILLILLGLLVFKAVIIQFGW